MPGTVTGMATYKTQIGKVEIEVERGGAALWHLFASNGDASISTGPFKTRKAAIEFAVKTLGESK